MANNEQQQQVLAGRDLISQRDVQQGHEAQERTHAKYPKESSNRLIFNIDTQNISGNIGIPDLYVRYNPKNLTVGYTKIITETQTKNGWVEEHWGEEIGNISASNTTGAFVDTIPRLVPNRKNNIFINEKLQWNRTNTGAYIDFKKYIELFMNNGCYYGNDGVPYEFGKIQIYYANALYQGSFENFVITEEDETPYNFNFDWTFKVEKTIFSL